MTWLMVVVSSLGGLIAAYLFFMLVVAESTFRSDRRVLELHEQPVCGRGAGPMFVVVVPARNEQLVIVRTIEALATLLGERFIVLVMDDGSTDLTGTLARHAARGDHRFVIVERPAEVAGRGKGDVLNHACAIASALVADESPLIQGADADEVVLCVLDADGWLDRTALACVAPYFDDPHIAGVQVPVRMWNARSGFLARMQDIEFVGFGYLLQAARDRFGSVLMGGNGQFMRLASLQELGPEPWTRSLTEDLDIGLRLMKLGWRHRFCTTTKVSQQALGDRHRFVRQRTRWVQGQLGCWEHIPMLWGRRVRLSLFARIDLTVHLLLATFGLVAALHIVAVLLLSAGTATGAVALPAISWAPPPLLAGMLVLLAITPILFTAMTYVRHANAGLPIVVAPGVFLLYGLYHYLWSIPATFLALHRIANGQADWTKTQRTSIDPLDVPLATTTPAEA